MMKKLLALLTMLPFVILADIPSPTYIYRLHRVGYEILPEPNLSRVVITKPLESLQSQSSVTCWAIMVLALLLGAAIVLIVRNRRMSSRVGIAALMRRSYAHLNLNLLFVALGLISPIVLSVMYFGPQIVEQYAVVSNTVVPRGGTIYVDEPGWKYPTELSEKEQTDFNSRLNSLPLRMRELIEAKWRKDPSNGSDDHAKAVVLEVLRNDAELRSACIGIPVELIVSNYFITEKWRQYYVRHSFTHPRTVHWDDMKAKIEKINDEAYMKSHPRSKWFDPEHKFVD